MDVDMDGSSSDGANAKTLDDNGSVIVSKINNAVLFVFNLEKLFILLDRQLIVIRFVWWLHSLFVAPLFTFQGYCCTDTRLLYGRLLVPVVRLVSTYCWNLEPS
jgi:hypothetical protein